MKTGLSLLIFMLPVICLSQDLSDKPLMTVAGNRVTAGEFIRMYNKSKVTGTPSDIDEYLRQYIVFKLKVADAINEGMDDHELVKIKFLEFKDEKKTLVSEIENKTGGNCVGMIGHVAIFYRQQRDPGKRFRNKQSSLSGVGTRKPSDAHRIRLISLSAAMPPAEAGLVCGARYP